AGPRAPAPTAESAEAASAEAPRTDTPDRSLVAAPARIRIEVVDADGRPTAGRLAVLVSELPPCFSQGATLQSPWPDPEMQILAHDGSVSIEAGQADWISIHAVGPAGAAFLLSPPSPEREHLRLQLATTRRSARVLVLDADHQSLLRDGELTVQRPADEGSGAPERVAIDADGITEVDFLD